VSIVPLVVLPPVTALPVAPVTSQVTVVFVVPVTLAVNCCWVLSTTVAVVSLSVITIFEGAELHPSVMAAHSQLSANQNLRDLMIPVPPTLFKLSMPPLAAISFFRMTVTPAFRTSG
jgi:hypothetical protein